MPPKLNRILILVIPAIAAAVIALVLISLSFVSKKPTVNVDCSKVVGKAVNLIGVNDGPMGPYGWEKAYVNNFTKQYIDMGVKFIRVHDLWELADIDVVFPNFKKNPADESAYDFFLTDRHVRYMLNTGAQIIYRLGYSYSDPPKNKPPSDFEKWAEVCLHIVKHYTEGWANGMHDAIKYWEIWNEPDYEPFWTGTVEEYFRLYNITARKIKNYNPSLLVGGPGLAYRIEFLDAFLRMCRDNKAPLDFVSWHIYTNNPKDVYTKAISIRSLMKQYGFSDKLCIITEWNVDTDSDYDLCRRSFGASFTAATLMLLQDAGVNMTTFYRGDSWTWGGIFYRNGTAGKVYYVMVAFKEIFANPFRLKCDSDSNLYTMATKSEDGKSVILVVSNHASKSLEYVIKISNLPWSGSFYYELLSIDDTSNLSITSSGRSSGNSLELPVNINPYSVQILKLKPES
ncbi:MAG: hypothetical protein QXR97_06855 [Thermoproteota archaeon]